MRKYSARFGGGHTEKGGNAPRRVPILQHWAFAVHWAIMALCGPHLGRRPRALHPTLPGGTGPVADGPRPRQSAALAHGRVGRITTKTVSRTTSRSGPAGSSP